LSISVPRRARGRSSSGRAGTAGLRRTISPGPVTSSWCTTPSPGAGRRFDLSRPTPRLAARLAAQEALWQQQGVEPTEDERFDFASGLHEDTLAKAAGALGQTFAGAVLADDLVALRVLAALRASTPRGWARSGSLVAAVGACCWPRWIHGSRRPW
jgi:hypothetical protein